MQECMQVIPTDEATVAILMDVQHSNCYIFYKIYCEKRKEQKIFTIIEIIQIALLYKFECFFQNLNVNEHVYKLIKLTKIKDKEKSKQKIKWQKFKIYVYTYIYVND